MSDANITRLLQEVDDGQDGALDRLMEAVYAQLEQVAARHMKQRFGPDLPGVTLEPAALVNESFLKLIKQRRAFDNRGHFFAIATKVMLRVLIDYKRSRLAARRGGDRRRITLALDGPAAAPPRHGPATLIEIESLSTALTELEALDPRQADVVKMRVVWGLGIEEIAKLLGISAATVKRDWRFARAWLMDEITRLKEGGIPS